MTGAVGAGHMSAWVPRCPPQVASPFRVRFLKPAQRPGVWPQPLSQLGLGKAAQCPHPCISFLAGRGTRATDTLLHMPRAINSTAVNNGDPLASCPVLSSAEWLLREAAGGLTAQRSGFRDAGVVLHPPRSSGKRGGRALAATRGVCSGWATGQGAGQQGSGGRLAQGPLTGLQRPSASHSSPASCCRGAQLATSEAPTSKAGVAWAGDGTLRPG